jgi:F-type H+-transporting ATPase subunit c
MFELMSGVLAAGESPEVVVEVAETATKSLGEWQVLGVFGAVIGAGIIVFGAALGISRIAVSATESIARQPEAGARIFTSMLLAAAFIEGGMLLALIVCFFAMWRLSA